ncbi:hypothetical protein JW979_02550, partial [bacterium]|nr:hypothetical protein [candidate division CSSED10-310 bacterium]
NMKPGKSVLYILDGLGNIIHTNRFIVAAAASKDTSSREIASWNLKNCSGRLATGTYQAYLVVEQAGPGVEVHRCMIGVKTE